MKTKQRAAARKQAARMAVIGVRALRNLEHARIKVLASKNPRRESSRPRRKLYKTGMSPSTYLKKGGTANDLWWDQHLGFIKIEARRC